MNITSQIAPIHLAEEGDEGTASPPGFNKHRRKVHIMLAKTAKILPARFSSVKSITKASLTVAILGLATVPASAYVPPTVERIVTVEFKASDVATTTGQADVYDRLLKTAYSACQSDLKTLKYLNESIEECVSDLMDQFIETANIETLTIYHQSQT